MKVFIFGGTTEGRRLSAEHIKKGDSVTVSVATDMGAEELSKNRGDSLEVLVGRLDVHGMEIYTLSLHDALPIYVHGMEKAIAGFDLVIDATHPYAMEASMNIKAACGNKGILYQRVERDVSYSGELPERVYYAADHGEAAEHLRSAAGNILLTTGSKNLKVYTDILLSTEEGDKKPSSDLLDRLYVRVLPTHEAISTCEECGIPHSHIIAMHGPFSAELNIAMIHEYDIKYLVTKETGAVGGFPEKVRAAIDTDIELVIVRK